MKFNHSYHHTLDRGYYVAPEAALVSDLSSNPQPEPVKTSLGPEEIGFSSNPFQRPIQAINARMKEGVGYIDIPFFGSGKGNKERYTPESVSSKERRDIRELAEINKVKLSTHASTNIMGLAGFGKEGFNEQAREESLREIKKAIDFASDLQGGAIVFHTGEWTRPFSEQSWNEEKPFVHYPEEENMAVLQMVDQRSGEVIGQIRKSIAVYEPAYRRADQNYTDSRGNYVKKGDFIDLEDNYLNPKKVEDLLRRVPDWDPDNEQFKTVKLTWDDFERRAAKTGRKPEEEWLLSRWTEQLTRARGGSLFYSQRYERSRRMRDSLRKALKFYEDLEGKVPTDEQWKLLQQDPVARYLPQGLTTVDEKMPSQILKEELIEVERSLKHTHEASSSHDVEAKTIQDRLANTVPIEQYGIRRSSDTIARAAEFAWKKTTQKKTERPIYVSPESYLPSFYGSHPDEMAELIDESRKNFKDMMKSKYKMSDKEADKLASQHIKGTLDVGHFNLWRQYFQANPGETPEQTDKRFNKWYLGKVEKLIKAGKIGQVHITDNMGFDDEHLTPGQGNVPMEEVIKIVEDSGIKDIVVEGGSFNPQKVVPETMQFFGSPVYSGGGPGFGGAPPSFAQFHERQFGYTAPPFYVVGAYSPSNDWKLWSEVQFE